eukprot:2603035-Amphidinium_carterae.1
MVSAVFSPPRTVSVEMGEEWMVSAGFSPPRTSEVENQACALVWETRKWLAQKPDNCRLVTALEA